MASELLKTKALAARIKEPKVRDFDFGLNLMSVESLIPDLPQPKPQELLDIQEENRKGRLLDSLNKIGGGLMNESVDFIKRENFAQAGKVGNYPKTNQEDLQKLRTYLKSLPTGTDILANPLAKKFNIDRRTINLILEREFPKLNVLGQGAGQAANVAKMNKERKETTEAAYEKILKEGYLDDYKLKIQKPSGASDEGLKNPDLAKKYFPDVSESTGVARIEKLNRYIRKKYPNLTYKKITPKEYENRRKDRLKITQGGKYFKGTESRPFHHIMPIGGETALTTKDVAFISKEMNSKLAPYNKKLNEIADAVTNNFNKALETADYKPYMDRIDQLNQNAEQIIDKVKKELPKKYRGYIGFTKLEPIYDENAVPINISEVRVGVDDAKSLAGKKGPKIKLSELSQSQINLFDKKITNNESKDIAKKLASFGFKCSASEGGSCDNPMNYLDDIKKQQAIATGSGNAAANAVKKLSAGKTIMREFIGPAALGFELAAAVPITYLGYKAGLPPARIVADATYGIFGDTEKARLKKIAVDEGIDTSGLDKVFEFQDKSKAMQTLAQQEGEFRGPDDEMQFPQQYEKGEEDFYKAVGGFRDEEGNVSKKVYDNLSEQLKRVEDIVSAEDTARADERSSRIANFGIGDYIDFNSGGRVNYSNGSDGTALAIEESLEAFQRYLKAGGKLGYKDFISLGNEGVSKFFNAGGRVGFADGPDNPKRRTFMKVMAGIASLPILGKFFKGAKSAKVVKLANTTTIMPDWFPNFVENAFAKGVAKKIDADLTELEIPELPGVKVQAHDDGRIMVEGKNAYNEPYEINYTPPGYEVIDETTGKAVKTKGEFEANDTVYYRTGDPREIDYDVDYTTVKEIDDILGGNATELEGFAKGTNKSKITKGQRSVDEADGRLDVDEGPDIDMSDYDND